ncbi:MAG: hypothetical protein R3D29_16480 [Nitratireductor sp.]
MPTRNGKDSNDTLNGTSRDDRIYGNGGNDISDRIWRRRPDLGGPERHH